MGNTSQPSWRPAGGARAFYRRNAIRQAQMLRRVSRHPLLNDAALGEAARTLVPGTFKAMPESVVECEGPPHDA